jgi:hypothetical protein
MTKDWQSYPQKEGMDLESLNLNVEFGLTVSVPTLEKKSIALLKVYLCSKARHHPDRVPIIGD